MTDLDLIAKKLATVETCVADLRRLARPAELATDLRERRFVEHTLQIAIQTMSICRSCGMWSITGSMICCSS